MNMNYELVKIISELLINLLKNSKIVENELFLNLINKFSWFILIIL